MLEQSKEELKPPINSNGNSIITSSVDIKQSISKAYSSAMKALQNRIMQLEKENADLTNKLSVMENDKQKIRMETLTELDHRKQTEWKARESNKVLESENKQLKKEILYLEEENQQLRMQLANNKKVRKEIEIPIEAEKPELKKQLNEISDEHELKIEELHRVNKDKKKVHVKVSFPKEDTKITKIEEIKGLKNRHLKCIRPALPINLSSIKKPKKLSRKQRSARVTNKSSYLTNEQTTVKKKRNHSTKISMEKNIKDDTAPLDYNKPNSMELEKISKLEDNWKKGRMSEEVSLLEKEIASLNFKYKEILGVNTGATLKNLFKQIEQKTERLIELRKQQHILLQQAQ